MSCLSFNLKLFPARNTWKQLRLKIQTKFNISHKLPNKTISSNKKNKCIKKKKKFFSWNILQCKKFKPKKPSSITTPLHKYYQNRPCGAPVYIDQLFIQPTVVSTPPVVKSRCHSTVSSFMVQPPTLLLTNTNKEPCCSSSTTRSRAKKPVEDSCSGDDNNIVGDEMWESLEIPPHMDGIGINERAEEFIASVRAEMQLQEIPGPPYMDGIGINERAEEFIASVRAEMQLQEIIACRRL